jgi:hypothetical protein
MGGISSGREVEAAGKVRTVLFLPSAASPVSSPASWAPWAAHRPLVALRLPPASRDPLGVFSAAYSVALPRSTDPVCGWAAACCVRSRSVFSYPWRGCEMPWWWRGW